MSELSLYWFSPDFSCNCYIIRFHQLFLYWFSPLGVRGSCFGFPGWHTFWQWMWQRLDKVWYHHGLNKDFMIALIRIEGGSNYDNKRCATSSSTAPSVDRFDCSCDDHWFGIFWEMFGLITNFAPTPLPIKGQKKKFVLSSMDHPVDCVTTQILWRHPQLQLRQREPLHDCYVSDFLFLSFYSFVCCFFCCIAF